MTQHHLGFVLRTFVAHRDRSNLKFHFWTSAAGWLGLVTALSALPLPARIPWLGANAGAWFVVLSVLYWIPADAIVAISMALLAAVWAALMHRMLDDPPMRTTGFACA